MDSVLSPFGNWTFDVFLVLLVATGIALWFKQIRIALVTVGSALVALSTDLIAPPYSACSFAAPGTELAAKAVQNIRLTDDLFSCGFVNVGKNFNILNIDLPFRIPFTDVTFVNEIPLLIPVFLALSFIFLVLFAIAAFRNKALYWMAVFGFAGFMVYVLYAIGGETTTVIRLTSASLFVYFVLPVALYLTGVELISFAGTP